MKNLFLSFVAACFTLLACAQAPSISILGDSYSTFEGYVTPSTNEMWYYEEPGNRTDVDDVSSVTEHGSGPGAERILVFNPAVSIK